MSIQTPIPTTSDRNKSKYEKDCALTRRQIDVIRLISESLDNNTIASKLHVQGSTVCTHIVHACETMGVNSKLGLVIIGLRNNIISFDEFLMSEKLIEHADYELYLSQTKRSILKHMANTGGTHKEVALKLCKEPDTIKRRVRELFQQFYVNSRINLLRRTLYLEIIKKNDVLMCAS